MGVSDLKNHVVKKVFKMPEGTSGKLSCVALFIAVCWFIASFSAGLFSTLPATKDMLITSMHWDGLNVTGQSWSVTFPQVVFCPTPGGVITDIQCFKSNSGWFDTKGLSLVPTTLRKGTDMNHPNWSCMGFNLDAQQITDPTMTMFCKMNSTDTGRYNNETGRVSPVRVYLDEPGTDDYLECENCVDGIDGTWLLEKTTTLAFFEADVVQSDQLPADDDDDTTVDYRTTANRMPTQPQLGEVCDMDVVLGFYTRDVWEFKGISEYASMFAGERFGDFVWLLGGCGVFAYGLYVVISTLLILLIVGDEQTGGSSTEKRALLG